MPLLFLSNLSAEQPERRRGSRERPAHDARGSEGWEGVPQPTDPPRPPEQSRVPRSGRFQGQPPLLGAPSRPGGWALGPGRVPLGWRQRRAEGAGGSRP